MARIKYFYNTETCEFEKSELNWRTISQTVKSYLLFGLVVAAVLYAFRFFVFDTPKEKFLINKNVELKEGISKIENEIVQLESDIQNLHVKDNELYRSIFNLEPITDGQWDGGTGGSAEIKPPGDETLEETQNKIKHMITKVTIQEQSFEDLMEEYYNKEDELKHVPSILPCRGVFVSGFGLRFHPILKINRMHKGMDFAAKTGTPVYAVADGIVEFAAVHENGYGIHIDLNHGYGYETRYAHLSKVKVRRGQKVKRGDIIGLSGNTGLSKGPHVHYEILKDGKQINPIDYFYSDLSPVEYVDIKKLAELEREPMD